MRVVITPEQVVALAFGECNYLSADVVSVADIAAAQSRYIVPIVGEELLEMILEGDYGELADEYVAPALAYATRLIVQPAINLRMGDSGLVAPRGDAMQSPGESAVEALMGSLKIRTRQLLKRLSAFLNQNIDTFPEYKPECNVLNRCSIDGGFVQIF